MSKQYVQERTLSIQSFSTHISHIPCPGRDEQMNLINRRSLSSQGVLESRELGCGSCWFMHVHAVGLGFGKVTVFFRVHCWESSDYEVACTTWSCSCPPIQHCAKISGLWWNTTRSGASSFGTHVLWIELSCADKLLRYFSDSCSINV